MKKFDKTTAFIFGICALAAILRLWGISNGLPEIFHPDESMLIRRSLRMSTGDLNPHFFIYPSLSIYLYFFLSGLHFVAGMVTGTFHSTSDFAKLFFTDPTWFYLLPRLLICFSDICTVYFIIKLGCHLFSPLVGYTAGFAWATFPQGLNEAQVAKPDALMVSLALLALWLLLQANNSRKILMSGLVLGLAISAKYQAVIPVPMYMLWILISGQKWRAQWPVAIGFGLMVSVGFVLGTPFSLLSPLEFWRDFHSQSEVMRLGMFGLEGGPRGWMVYLRGLLAPGGSPAWGLAFIIGAGACILKKKNIALIVLGIPAILFVGLGLQRIASVHYMYLGYPFVFLLAAYGLTEISYKIRPNPRNATRITVVFLLLAMVPFYTKAWAHMRQFTDGDTRVSSRKWVEQNIPSGSRILVDADTPPLRMTPTQLEDLYQRAKAVGHVKADYFYLAKQYSSEPTYKIFLTKQAVMLNPKSLVEYSRLVQDLIDINQGLDEIKAQGVQYVFISSTEANQYLNPEVRTLYPAAAAYYEEVEAKGTLLAEFPSGPTRTGPTIKIFQL